MRATVADGPIDGAPENHGAVMARLIVKIPPTGPQFQVPCALLPAGSVSGPGQPIGPPTWLQDIAASSPWPPEVSTAVENDCWAADSVVSVMRWARVSARMTWLVMKRP